MMSLIVSTERTRTGNIKVQEREVNMSGGTLTPRGSLGEWDDSPGVQLIIKKNVIDRNQRRT